MKSVTAKLDSIEGIEKYPWGKLLADLHEAARECSKNQEAMNNFFMYRDGRQLLKILEKHTTASKDGTAHIDETFQMFNNEMQVSWLVTEINLIFIFNQFCLPSNAASQ